MPLSNLEVDLIRNLLTRTRDFHKKRITNANPSIHRGDYVTQGQLNDIGINIGFGKDGSLVITEFKTAESGERLEIDSTNLLRIYSSGGTLRVQIDPDVLAILIKGLTGDLQIGDNALNNFIKFGATEIVSVYATDATLTAKFTKTLVNLIPKLQINGVDVIKSTGKVIGDDTAYNATTWNGNDEVATKNAIRDQIETLVTSIAAKATAQAITGATIPLAKITPGGTDGSITVNVEGVVTAYVAPT